MALATGPSPSVSRPAGGQILAQAASLAWRVPCPRAPGPDEPAVLAPLESLRQAAVAAWPQADAGAAGVGGKPAPLVAYAAALFVAARCRPELSHTLRKQGATVLHALAYLYAEAEPQAAARAAHLAADTLHRLGEPAPWEPAARTALLDLQAQVHAAWTGSKGTAADAFGIARLYAAAQSDDVYAAAAAAFWTRTGLMLASPPVPTPQERLTLSTDYLSRQFALRERHAGAAVAVLEPIVRSGLAEQRLKEAREELRQRQAERLAYVNSIGAYVAAEPSPVDAEPLELPEPTVVELAHVRAEFDATLQRAMDAWAATDAGRALGRPPTALQPETRVLSNILGRAMGCGELGAREVPSLRTAEAWKAALLATATQMEAAYALGYGGVGREADLEKVRQAREVLLRQ